MYDMSSSSHESIPMFFDVPEPGAQAMPGS